MVHVLSLPNGVTLRCISDQRFKHACLSLQLLRPVRRDEAAANALLPAVLLRGCKSCPDLRRITLRLDDLYGASIGSHVRRVGDYHTTGFYASFLEDRFTMAGDAVLAPLAEFLLELLLEPVTENGAFCQDYVESEKKNLVSTIESRLNDKAVYAHDQMVRHMCKGDSTGIPRLGDAEDVKKLTAESLYAHYRKILSESPVEIFYVGSARPEEVAGLFSPMFRQQDRQLITLPPQTPMLTPPSGRHSQTMDVSQGKLCMGFLSPVTVRDPDIAAMQVLNMIFGGGMTSKLFMQVRETLSLCYAISSSFYGTKGILTVSAGIHSSQEETVRREILHQLQLCREGAITEEELTAAREALRSSLRSVHDAPGAMENYYANGLLSGMKLSPREYMEQVERVTAAQVADLARKLVLHTEFFLKGETV